MTANLTVIILTFNEELNISRSVSNVIEWAKHVFVLDSGSTDKTVEIAKSLEAQVFYNKFESYARQRNHAIKELPVETEWILFLDADEYLTEELKKEIEETVNNTEYDGFYIKYRMIFLDKWIKHGGYYPIWILRLFKKDKVTVTRDMNEHIKLNGNVGYLNSDFIHADKKSVFDWIEKHNKYSNYEALEFLKYNERKKEHIKDEFANIFGTQAQKKRWIRENIWNSLMPPLVRPFVYFSYRYFLRLGFLDGKEGFIFHFLQGLWFPFLIDVKYIEMKRKKK